jgi:hypothetical protein
MADWLAYYPSFCVEATLGTGETTHTLKAAPGVNLALYVTALYATVLTAAAQVIDIEAAGAGVKVLRLAASVTKDNMFQIQLTRGLKLTSNTALVVTPGAAGPSIHVVAEGYIGPG